jgi:hypothetical protein
MGRLPSLLDKNARAFRALLEFYRGTRLASSKGIEIGPPSQWRGRRYGAYFSNRRGTRICSSAPIELEKVNVTEFENIHIIYFGIYFFS